MSHGCAGPAGGPVARRQAPFEGSLRQLRDRLPRRLIASRASAIEEVDREAASGLAQDGLAVLADGVLIAP
ncbi:MAG: hypothetical protein ACLP01_14910 [Solirubrobacteraceae bacterium]